MRADPHTECGPSRGPTPRQRRVALRSGAARLLDVGDPQAPPVILLHGLGTVGEEMMDALGPYLAGLNLRVLAPDRPGYGFSDGLRGASRGPRGQALWLDDLIDRLGLRQPVLVAHSSGAAVALALASRSRRPLAGLVLVSPFARPTRPARMPLLRLATLPVLGRPVRAVVGLAAPVLGPRMLAAAEGSSGSVRAAARSGLPWRRMATGRAILAMRDELLAFNRDMAGVRTRLKRIACPVAILAGQKDPVLCMPPQVAWITQRVRQSAVIWFPAAGHRVHHEHAERVAEAIASMTAGSRDPPDHRRRGSGQTGRRL